MQATPDKEFDKMFQKKFETFEVEPSSAVWRGITAELDKGKKKTFPVFQMIAVAASVLIVLSMGLWLFSPEEKIRLQGKADVVMQDVEPDNSVSQPIIKDEEKGAEPISRQIERPVKKQEPVVAVVSGTAPVSEEKITVKEPQRLAEAPVKEAEPAKPVNVIPKQEEREKTKPVEDQAVLAFVGNQNSATDRRDTDQQHRVKTVGDLVNFVIGKVDPREDKLIQFKNDEEGGSEVTGINLGLLKFKNRNR